MLVPTSRFGQTLNVILSQHKVSLTFSSYRLALFQVTFLSAAARSLRLEVYVKLSPRSDFRSVLTEPAVFTECGGQTGRAQTVRFLSCSFLSKNN